MQTLHPDRFFTAAQQQRLETLMARWRTLRDQGDSLPAAEQAELEDLIAVELEASSLRAAELADAASIHTMHFGRLLKALAFAARAHREQRRKGSGEPYVNHLIEVAELLARVAAVEDVDILAAAVLHDVIEDTRVSGNMVERAFGPRVRALVEALTDDKSLPKAERKRLQVEHMRDAERDVRLIKLADLCSNLASLPAAWSAERKVGYLVWSEQVVAACAATHPDLEREYHARLAKAHAKLAGDHRLNARTRSTSQFPMTCIEAPGWARRAETRLDGMRLSDYHAIQRRRAQMLEAVHLEVEEYLNTPELYVENDDDGFPNRSCMTGEYYVLDESYTTHVGPVWFQVGIKCHCLKKPSRPDQKDRDYLGLNVWLRCDPTDWSFSVFRNTDSSVI